MSEVQINIGVIACHSVINQLSWEKRLVDLLLNEGLQTTLKKNFLAKIN